MVELALAHQVNLHWLFTGIADNGPVPVPLLPEELKFKKIAALVVDLTDRQITQMEWMMSDWHTINRLTCAHSAVVQQN